MIAVNHAPRASMVLVAKRDARMWFTATRLAIMWAATMYADRDMLAAPASIHARMANTDWTANWSVRAKMVPNAITSVVRANALPAGWARIAMCPALMAHTDPIAVRIVSARIKHDAARTMAIASVILVGWAHIAMKSVRKASTVCIVWSLVRVRQHSLHVMRHLGVNAVRATRALIVWRHRNRCTTWIDVSILLSEIVFNTSLLMVKIVITANNSAAVTWGFLVAAILVGAIVFVLLYYRRRVRNLKTEIAHVQYIADPLQSERSHFDNPVYDLSAANRHRPTPLSYLQHQKNGHSGYSDSSSNASSRGTYKP